MFVLVIGMAYRYLFVLLAAVQDMYVARRARRDRAGARHRAAAAAFVGATAGALFGKAHVLADEVHQAMTSRGYRGDARTLDRFRITAPRHRRRSPAPPPGMLLLIGGDRAIG